VIQIYLEIPNTWDLAAICALTMLSLIEGEHRAKKRTYDLRVKVSPKIGVFLFLEKAKTGKNMPEIVEEIFYEYAINRSHPR